MSAPDAPADNSIYVAQMQREDAARAKEQEKVDLEKKRVELEGLRGTSRDNARTSSQRYFQSLDLDPNAYSGDIDSQLNDILTSIAPTDENPGSYFKNAGQDIYGNLTRTKQMRDQAELDKLFAPDFENSRINMTMDDPVLAGIEKDQRGSADAIIQNMLKRGVLTNTGAAGASADLDRQASGVRGKLEDFGSSVLAGGQQKLRDVAQQARTTAGTSKLGQTFDPSSYSKNADQVFNDFVASMGDQIKAKIPGNLFQTNGLAAIGGAAQGAGNTKYDPKAAAGLVDPDDPFDVEPIKPKTSGNSIF